MFSLQRYPRLILHLVLPAADVGKPVELPSSFIGSEPSMKQLYQDALSLLPEYGQPSFFVTKTCNPMWPEIQRELIPNVQTAQDRHDLIARVFNMKLKALLHDVVERGCLGRGVSRVHTIEFQKRGLPHAHMLFIIHADDRPRTADDVDAWSARRGGKRCIGRIYFLSTRAAELFYLRMLLHVVTSPQSFEYLRTYQGVLHHTFKKLAKQSAFGK